MLEWLFSAPLPVGAAAPDFNLPDDTGAMVSLSSMRGLDVLLVFYPADNTPGCTKQLCQLRDDRVRLKTKNVQVFGINPQNAHSHAGFRTKHRLPFPLLVDSNRRVAKLYHSGGLWIRRTVYLIGKDGKVLFSRRGMPWPDEISAR